MEKEPEIKGRLDRIGKTTLEHFQDIKELEVADGPEITVVDIVPYKCKQVEKSLKALEIIKRFIWVEDGKLMCGIYADTEIELEEEEFEDEEEFNVLKEWLKNE